MIPLLAQTAWDNTEDALNIVFDAVAFPSRAAIEFVTGALSKLQREFTDALETFARWAVCFFFEIISPILQYMLDIMPDGVQGTAISIMEFFGHANEWLPISLFFQYMVAYVGFALVFSVIKLVVKGIPTVG